MEDYDSEILYNEPTHFNFHHTVNNWKATMRSRRTKTPITNAGSFDLQRLPLRMSDKVVASVTRF